MGRATRVLPRWMAVLGLTAISALGTTVLASTNATAGSAASAAGHAATNGKIVFRQYLDDSHNTGEIFAINPDGTGLFQVTHSGALATEPDPSPNGRWLDYMVEYPTDPTGQSHIFKIRPDGSDPTDLSATSCTGMCQGDGFPDWSTTRWIAFERVQSADFNKPVGFSSIFVMRPNGSHAHQLTQLHADPAQPARFDDLAPGWAPNGRRLAFERVNDTTGHHAIFTMTRTGHELRRITPWRLDASQPQYSPNGRWIAFRSDETSDVAGNIYLVHPDGRRLHRLTRTPAGTGKWLSCAFSPDGRYVVAAMTSIAAGQQQNAAIFTIPVHGGTPVDVTNDPQHWDSAPDWGIGQS